jgi:oligopeptide/dipeptide ABC transporter ATP-binding protein
VQTIGFHLAEASLCREGKATVASLWKASTWRQNGFYHDGLEALHRVGLPQPEEMLGRYPHQLSGGMRQRVLLALALLLQPRLLICDEPTTALDPETKAGILSLLEATAQQSTMLLISHDMVAIRRLANRVAVMYAGAIVEEGERRGVLDQPQHPYTQALLASQKMERGSPLVPIAGDVPDLMNFPGGCSFHTRCLQALPICSRVEPALNQRGDRRVACHLYG